MQHLIAHIYSLVSPPRCMQEEFDPDATPIGDCMKDLMKEFAYSKFVCAINKNVPLVYKKYE